MVILSWFGTGICAEPAGPRLWLDNGHLHRSRVVDGVPLHCDQGRKAQQSDNGEAGDDPSLPDRLARSLAPGRQRLTQRAVYFLDEHYAHPSSGATQPDSEKSCASKRRITHHTSLRGHIERAA